MGLCKKCWVGAKVYNPFKAYGPTPEEDQVFAEMHACEDSCEICGQLSPENAPLYEASSGDEVSKDEYDCRTVQE